LDQFLLLKFIELEELLPWLVSSFPCGDYHRLYADINWSEVRDVVGAAIHRSHDAEARTDEKSHWTVEAEIKFSNGSWLKDSKGFLLINPTRKRFFHR
jgi:hypothetical protein